MQTYCIILAAGNSKRFSNKNDKLFSNIHGSPLIFFTLTNILKVFKKNEIFIVINKNLSKKHQFFLKTFTDNKLIHGGTSRFKSLKNATNYFNKDVNLLIHDAARPNIKKDLIKKIKNEIENMNVNVVVPYTLITDTLKNKKMNKYYTVKRSQFINTQTPQALKLDKTSREIISSTRNDTTDESEIFDKSKLKIKYLLGSNKNIKVTNKDDLGLIKNLLGHSIKIGNAFDIHRISKGKFLSLGGIKFKSNYSLIGHSDGDVVIHAIIDVLLGALGKKDIGYYFPSSNKLYKNINSVILLNEIYKRFKLKNVLILNLDITIISEAIRLEKYKSSIRKNVSKLLNCPVSRVNIKAKSSDQIGIIGRSKGIACMASILIYK
ncbi:MAG: 2-C-methyl-D-erythritol 2,4-cyclodiphosphate synthase [Pelagibacterales bacterium]|nr:2-C-methyl-D-erythritol 2,4-cyclodiphosphate synthase [Pelagibacterales bacterium]